MHATLQTFLGQTFFGLPIGMGGVMLTLMFPSIIRARHIADIPWPVAILEKHLPKSLATKPQAFQVNQSLWQYTYSWQSRYDKAKTFGQLVQIS